MDVSLLKIGTRVHRRRIWICTARRTLDARKLSLGLELTSLAAGARPGIALLRVAALRFLDLPRGAVLLAARTVVYGVAFAEAPLPPILRVAARGREVAIDTSRTADVAGKLPGGAQPTFLLACRALELPAWARRACRSTGRAVSSNVAGAITEVARCPS